MAQANRVFRVFISSTFADLKAERDALQERVFPRLRDHCAASGYSFQAIDLRWGIGDEASAGQRTMRICLDEIARCQEVTPRPNFLVLLGDRYGWRPLPEEVPRAEFEAVRAELDPEAAVLADTWYRLDTNAAPAGQELAGVYRLQPRTDETEAAWNEAQAVLAPALRTAAGAAQLGPDALVKYTTSATEQEILAGALDDEVEAKSVFAFLRTISGLPESAAAKRFRDLTLEGAVDTEAVDLLADLKGRLRSGIGESNVKRYSAAWDGDAPSTGHIDQLCNDVFGSLTSVIDAEIERLGGSETTSADEAAAHELFRIERGSSFTGRDEYRAAIARYLDSGDASPLLVWGYGGSGKSALLAQAIEDARGAHADAVVIHRFIGATPASADLRLLLQSLFMDIGTAYGLEGETPSDFNELVHAFRERLAAAGSTRPLLLFIDSLDQLSTGYGAHGFSWLPTSLPEGVRLVTSIRAEEADERSPREQAAGDRAAMSGPLGTLQHMLPETALLELGPMSVAEGEKLLDRWLALAERTLTGPQRDAVMSAFGKCQRPLHLRLAFATARRWSSYDEPEGIRDRVRDMVAALYERLEREHGATLVGRTLAYLAASRNAMGLAEDEILSLFPAEQDTGVLGEFNERTRPEHRPADGSLPSRLPVVVWSRLFFDLQPYLGTRSSEGASLLAFYHRELAEVATKRYLEGNRAARHATLASMFRTMADPAGDGSWSGRARALSELPYHLTGAREWQAVYEALTDFTFLEEKAARVGVIERPESAGGTLYTGVYALLEDYETALAAFPAE
ncbi:AAA family ATPase [Anaerosoma tenue]|uniref:AAA family ATPase n=1 Tax=Anaerosoma tenue TaxID=2933588 RepID=UPI00226102E2|nr:AAA family ATPase [Anaerosoma tenue]MCK8114881.1 DUF4062 domain-containing protein [Anaerosoma tenue]